MRRKRLQDVEEEIDLNITPMLDVVFIILIFFVVSTSFVKESGVDVSRPDASTSERKQRGNIMIGITADDAVWIDRRQVDIRAVRANIERLHAENPEGAVVIQADRDARTGVLVQVIDQSRQAGVSDVSIAANRHKEIRAALCHEAFTARMSREHNNSNVLCLGGRVIGSEIALDIVKTWVETEFAGGRHQRRLDMFS